MSNIVFAATTEIAKRALWWLTNARARGHTLHHFYLTAEAGAHLCDYYDYGKLHDEDNYVRHAVDCLEPEAIGALQPDIAIAIWQSIIPPEVLAIPRHGFIGFHGTLLPDYRGRAVIPHTIIHGLPRTGMTMMQLAAKADTGDIVDQCGFYLSDRMTATDLYHYQAQAVAHLLSLRFDELLTGEYPRRPQTAGNGVVWPKRTPEDSRINWEDTQLDCFCRALTPPYPRPFAYFREQRHDGFWIEDMPDRHYGMVTSATANIGDARITAIDDITDSILVDNTWLIRRIGHMTGGHFARQYRVQVGEQFT